MYYASFGILALIHHLIINHDILKNGKKLSAKDSRYRYRQFLISVLIFYIADLSWGFCSESDYRAIAYADTIVFFVSMAFSVLFWTRFVVAFLGKRSFNAISLLTAGWFIFAFVILNLFINFFKPIIFIFTEDMEYIPGTGRYFLLVAQLIMYLISSLYSLFAAHKSEGLDKVHYRAIFLSCGVMTLFIIFQNFYPLVPFYTIGLIIANCIMHIFVDEDEKIEQIQEKEKVEKEKEIYNHISNSLAEDYEAIYYINIDTGKYKNISTSESYISLNVPERFEDFYSETRQNVLKYVHPDDRDFALSMYYKDTMLKNLEDKKSYAYKYRIMVGGGPRYYRFVVILTEDKKHLVLCEKDINDTITAETAMLERQKASITFSQIAESLASNYDAIYYVDTQDKSFVGFDSNNIYGELKVNQSGDDFFADAKESASILIHPQDRERLLNIFDNDYLITTLEDKKQFTIEYRLIIDDKVQHTRLTARKSRDRVHLIIGVENINEEVNREKEHLLALNTEKENARRDELTGTRNKTAFTELEKSIQENIDNGMGHMQFAFVVCDINDLKKINDTQGHKAGDEYIKASAKLICDIFDHSPVFRIGGDEFAVFLVGDDFTDRKKLVNKLRKTSIMNRDKNKGPVVATGIADFMLGKDNKVENVFERADKSMYENKRSLKA
jgi:diguanylate cyclase (GGDEF)-like protein